MRLIPQIMETSKTFESYPILTVVLSNLVSISIYFIGSIIIFKTWWVFFVFYLGLIFAMELRLIRGHCTNCYYWGKTCGFGKGRISSLLFKKGDSTKFCNKVLSWKDMIPDLLISLLPIIGGVILLLLRFDLLVLSSLIILVVLVTAGNGFIRGNLTCKNCIQREMGCPAEKLFSKGR
jgi:hypothetical protein